MSDDKMRAALEAAKDYMTRSHLVVLPECQEDVYSKTTQQIDEALKSEPESQCCDYKQMYEGLVQEIGDLKQALINQSGGRIRNQLLNLPDQIQAQSEDNAKTVESIEITRAEIAAIEADVEGIIAKDEGLTNADKRKAARKLALKGREDYAKKCADLAVLERAFKLGEIDLTHLNNLFRAYLAISGMGWVR